MSTETCLRTGCVIETRYFVTKFGTVIEHITLSGAKSEAPTKKSPQTKPQAPLELIPAATLNLR
jgi:hypothetical protein